MSLASPASSLTELGWDDDWSAALTASSHPSAEPGRVARVDLGACTVLTAAGLVRAATHHQQSVATGDWVVLATDDAVRVLDVLPRRTLFRRGSEGGETREQVVAANVDTVLIVNALDVRLSVRRIERYLALVWQSGASPAVVLTKSDVATADEREAALLATEAVALGVPVHLVSATTGEGMGELSHHLQPSRTTALLGSSGAGKSTLVNFLAGSEVAATGDVRSDGKGRHTTTHRELIVLPGRGMLLDTPGMRAISLWDAAEGVERTFPEIEELIAGCRFSDCSHEHEPGCAVRSAVADGRLRIDRLEAWQKLQRELRHQERRVDARVRQEDRKRWMAMAKEGKARARPRT